MKLVWQKLHKIGDILHLPNLPNWLVGLLAIILILRIPSFFEPYFYGDEMIYLTLGQGIRQNVPLYSNLHDNKPPLLYLTAAIAGNIFWFKVILMFWNLVTIILFFNLAKYLFQKNETAQKVSTVIFGLLTTLPLLEGLTVNSELFMIAFTIAAMLILLTKQNSVKNLLFAGALFGIGALYKIPAAFDAPIIVIYWLISGDLKNWREVFKKTLLLVIGFAIPIAMTFVWYFIKGAFPEYLTAAFLQNVGYVSSFRPGDIQKPFLVKNAPLLIRAFIVFAGSGMLFVFRKKLSKKYILITVWTLFALFAITLSERPYPHYLIQVLAPMSILLTMFFTEKTLEQSLVVIPLAITFFVPFYFKFWIYPTTSYYTRFVNFAIGKESKSEYFGNFTPTVNRNYAIAEFLQKSSLPKDKVFIWDGDSATIYALSNRLPPIKYVADYHINDYSTKQIEADKITASLPKFIILTDNYKFTEIMPLIKSKYILINRIENANIYSRIDFAPAK